MILEIPSGRQLQTWFIASDWHSDHIDKASYGILLTLAKTYYTRRPNLVILGDFLDVPYLMKRCEQFKTYARRADGIEEYFLPHLEREFEWGNQILDELQQHFSKIIFVEGNHDWRIRWFQESAYCPAAYKHNFDYIAGLKLGSRKIPWVFYNDFVDLGNDLSLTHGIYHGTTCLKKSYEAVGKSIIFGHVHRAETKAFSVRGKTHKAHSLPAMCHLNPEYMKNMPNNWTNGFGIVNLKPNGHFNYHLMEVWDGELILPDGEKISP